MRRRRNPQNAPDAMNTQAKMDRVRRKKRGHRVMVSIMFSMLMIYLLGYMVAFVNKPSVGIETVNYGTIDVLKEFSAIVVREEYVVSANMTGQPYFNYSHGDRVKKNAVVCTVKNTEASQDLEEQLKTLDKDILKAQKARSDISIFQEDIVRINKNIADSVATYLPKMISGDISQVYSVRSQIETQIDLRNEIWFTENSSSVSKLAQERQSYSNQLDSNVSGLTAASSGIVSLMIDGYEETITPENIASITKEQTKLNVKPTYTSKNKTVDAQSPVFKVVTSNTWYVVAYVPSEVSQQWAVGDVIELECEIEGEDKTVSFAVSDMQIGDKETRVEFKTDADMIDFLDVRTVEFRIKDVQQNGLKIPNNAIVEKVMIKIPGECVLNSLDEPVVIKRVGEADTKISLEVKSRVQREDSQLYDYYVTPNADALKIGDTILTGTDEAGTLYTIADVKTFKGVYIVNTSVAKFSAITILSQNADYTIVKSDSIVGLKVNDNIVSDAKNVEENDTVF